MSQHRTPTGTLENGDPCYTELDLKNSKGGTTISLLPPGDVPLVLQPSASEGSHDNYTGDPVHIKCMMEDGKQVFVCRHPVVKANPKKNIPVKRCNRKFYHSRTCTIGTLRTHARTHWMKVANAKAPNHGQKSINKIFLPVKRKADGDKEPPTSSDPGTMESSSPDAEFDTGELINYDFLAAQPSTDIFVERSMEFTNPAVIRLPSIAQHPELESTVEHLPCMGINIREFQNIDIPDEYDVVLNYPLSIHSNTTQLKYNNSNLLPKIDWTIDVSGNIKSIVCEGIINRDTANSLSVANTTTRAEKPACVDCIKLQYNQRLMGVLTTSIEKNYGMTLPNALIPISVLNERAAKLTSDVNAHRLSEKNYERKITSLNRKVDDNFCLLSIPMGLDNSERVSGREASLSLLNLVGGEFGATASCDNDHLGKRFRARIKSQVGITIGTVTFSKTDLTLILQKASILKSAAEAQRLFDPEDLMDVLETVRCLYAVGLLSNVAFHQFPSEWRSDPTNEHKFRELRVLGRVSATMCASIVGHYDDIEMEGTHMSINEYLTNLSEMSHLLFVLFRRHKTRFIAAQNYRNWQEMIKNMYISVTLAKLNGVTDWYWFLNTNKKIEELFGILRSFRGGYMNFDAEELTIRVGDATLCNWIYDQHPEWKQESRRLQSSADRKNPRSWKGDTKLFHVDEIKCWNDGMKQAMTFLRKSKLFDDNSLDVDYIIANEPGVDMFRPYQKQIGVLAGDRAEYDLVNLEEEDDDEDPEE
eukprot:scaffold10851_cov129-Cyclotella_meneghiniana.AAC.3